LIKLAAPPPPAPIDAAVKASPSKKLVIVVDELDSCRPDFVCPYKCSSNIFRPSTCPFCAGREYAGIAK
jgi:hypothetical protein